jgi:hypothetical protein
MKNISTGTGLCVLGLCLASYPIIDRVMPRAEAGATHVAAVVAAATAQVPPEPTIVYYSVVNHLYEFSSLWRAWSDGKVEMCRFRNTASFDPQTWCGPNYAPCTSPWFVVSDPAQGYTYRSDINFDSKVDGADLSQVLNDWGDAPRQDIPPSTCPLNLINP